jgi:microcin C transport system substrate-binding protein
MDWTRRDLGKLALSAGTLAAMPSVLRAESTRAHGISAFSDLKYPEGFTHFDYAMPGAPVGGTYSMGVGGLTFDSLNPFIIKGNPAVGLLFTTDSLMTGAADEPDSMYGLIAESVEVPEDRMYATFTLRAEARFADGSPITPEDVVFTVDALRTKGHPSYRVILAAVTGVSVEGPQRVRFDFSPEAARRDLPMTVAGLPVLSKTWFETRDFGASTLEPILGSGPYAVDRVEPGRTITYRRREDYWGWDLPVNRGRWNFGAIRIEYFRDRSADFEAFKAGTYTFREEFWSLLWATGYDFPAVQTGAVKRTTLPDNRPSGSQGYWFNLRRPQFQDPRVREAIALAFDFEWSNATLFYDLYTRTDSFFEGGPMEATGKPTPGELALLEPLADQLPPNLLDEPAYVPPQTDGTGRNRRGLRAAAGLLEEAGWTIQDGVRRNAAGQPLDFEFLSDSPSFTRITGPYVDALKRLGIQASLREVDPAQYKARVDDYDFDIVVDRKAMSLTPGVELRTYFHSDSANSPGSENLAGIADPVVDTLIRHVERAESREELTDAVRALDRVLRAMHVWVPQWSKATHHLAYWDIYGHPPLEMKPAYDRGVIDLWWIDPEKQAALAGRIGG